MVNFSQSIKEKIPFKGKSVFFAILLVLLGLFIFLSYETVIKTGVNLPWVKLTKKGFVKRGKPFKFIGANAVNIVFYDDWDLDIEKTIRTAKENNISVLRLYMDWGWGKCEDIDKIVDLASRHGIYIILTLSDCCCSSDCSNLKKYFEVHAPFCNITNKQSINAFKKRIKQIIERKNSINSRIYRNDPTILAWEIANELEYWHFAESDVRKWISELATYIKTLDKNHLLTISISISNYTDENLLYKIFDISTLDFFSFHFYPSSEILDANSMTLLKEEIFQIEFITKKLLSMGKPVIMSEFGFSNSIDLNSKIRSNKDTTDFYNLTFKKYMDTAFNAGCSGVMFWGWGVPEEKRVPMWWSKEDHSIADKSFCNFLKNYHIPEADER